MDERERDYLRQQIHELQRSKTRWKLATFTLVAALVMVLLLSGISTFLFGVVDVRRQRAVMEMEAARAAQEAARLEREQAAHQNLMQAKQAAVQDVQPPKERQPKEKIDEEREIRLKN